MLKDKKRKTLENRAFKKDASSLFPVLLIKNYDNILKYILIINLVLFSVTLRLWNLNAAGRTWDEFAYIQSGVNLIELIKQGNFSDNSWYELVDHPPMARYFYGAASYLDRIYKSNNPQKWYYRYDWQYTRLVSVVFFSLTVIFVVLLGSEISALTAVLSGIIFCMLPISLGLSQLVTLESPLIFFFTGTIYFFIQLLKKITLFKIILTGVFLGLAVGVKLSNLLLIPLIMILYLVWFFFEKKPHVKRNTSINLFLLLLFIYILGCFTFIIIWPGLWFHSGSMLQKTIISRFPQGAGRIYELFLGRNTPVPYYYFFLYFLFTTPLIVILFFVFGIRQIIESRRGIGYFLVVWFIFPFIQSFYNNSVNGIRYIIEIYSPLSIIAAIGFDYLVSKISSNVIIKSALFTPILAYLVIILIQISPYYLSYFNEIVGGPQKVYATRLFPLGWWGEGQKDAGNYISRHGFKNAKIGLAVIPKFVFPPLYLGKYRAEYLENSKAARAALSSKQYDFIVVNYLFLIRSDFPESLLRKDYTLVHSTLANRAPIVKVYKRK